MSRETIEADRVVHQSSSCMSFARRIPTCRPDRVPWVCQKQHLDLSATMYVDQYVRTG